MSGLILLAGARELPEIAAWIHAELRQHGFDVLLSTTMLSTDHADAMLVLLSPETIQSDSMLQDVNWARRTTCPLFVLIVTSVREVPWFLQGLPTADLSTNREHALLRLITRHLLHEDARDMTFGEARDAYLNRATLKSRHTLNAYERAISLFLDFLDDRSVSRVLPIQKLHYPQASAIPLGALTEDDAPLLLQFAQWLLAPGAGRHDDKRPYKATTVELRLAGVQNWFQFMDDYGWLPAEFKLARAKRIVRDELSARPVHAGPPQPPEHIEEVIYYYDSLELPKHLRKPDVSQERIQQWEITRLRNKALMHVLAETGGRISEVLSLNLDDFPARYLNRSEVLRVEVRGKGGHNYYLRFYDSLPAIRAYLEARGANLRASAQGRIPVFVSHDPNFEGQRMSRIVAWRVVQRAARALGLRSITPHDFRHWRATQLINAGHSLDVVQDYLGHRSVETTRAYYAHTDPLRVDDAARQTRLPEPGEEET